MKRNEIFEPAIPKDRNEFIKAVEEKKNVIYIQGKLFEDVIDQFNKDVSNKRYSKVAGFGGPVVAVTALSIINIPVLGWIAAAILTIIYGFLSISCALSVELRKYRMGFDGGNKLKDCTRIILVRKDYSYKYDSLTDGTILSDSAKLCPKCSTKYKNGYCNNCNQRVVYVFKVKHKIKEK